MFLHCLIFFNLPVYLAMASSISLCERRVSCPTDCRRGPCSYMCLIASSFSLTYSLHLTMAYQCTPPALCERRSISWEIFLSGPPHPLTRDITTGDVPCHFKNAVYCNIEATDERRQGHPEAITSLHSIMNCSHSLFPWRCATVSMEMCHYCY